jgi:hypothetical protein
VAGGAGRRRGPGPRRTARRVARGVDADLVRVGRLGERAALRFDARVYGVDFHVYAAYEQATAEAGAA